MRYQVVVSFALACSVVPTARGGDWPQFRGPGGAAQSDDKLPTEWAADKNVQWKIDRVR